MGKIVDLQIISVKLNWVDSTSEMEMTKILEFLIQRENFETKMLFIVFSHFTLSKALKSL